MKLFPYILSFLIFFAACNEEIQKPENLIPKQEMQDIIKEIYLYKQMRNYRLAPNLPAPPKTNLAILQKHGVTLEQFQQSYQYYVINNAAYDEFLEEIKLDLEKELPDSLRQKDEEKGKKELK